MNQHFNNNPMELVTALFEEAPLTVVIVALLAAKIGGEVAERFRQPSVLGELLAGLVMGGSVLGILQPTEILEIFAELGIILLLFMAGLEIDTKGLKAVGKTVGVASFFEVVFTMSAGYIVGKFFGFTDLQALFLGGTLSATSVGITTRTLMDIGKLNTKPGISILGVAVLDDIVGIFILSVLVAMAKFGGLPPVSDLIQLLAVTITFFALAFFLGRRLVTYSSRYIRRMHVDEAGLALTLVFILTLSVLAQEVKLAYIIGAFLSGLIISSSLEDTEEIKTAFRPMTQGFMAPIFFILVGLKTDLHVMSTASIFAVAIIIAVFVGQIGGGALGSYITGYSLPDSLRVGMGLLPKAEVVLIMATIGVNNGIFDTTIFSSIVVMAIFCAVTTPPLLKYAFRGVEAPPQAPIK